MTTAELESLQQEDQMNIVPDLSYIDSDSKPEGSKETVYKSESSEFSMEGKHLVDEEEESYHNGDM